MQIPTLGHCSGSNFELAQCGELNPCVCGRDRQVLPSASIS